MVNDLPRDLGGIISTFDDFRKVSGLHINISKTVVIPTGDSMRVNDATIRHYSGIMSNTPWSDVKVAKEGKYLGFLLGMNVDREEEYRNILRKIETRIGGWHKKNKLNLFD